MEKYVNELLRFIESSPSVYHNINLVKNVLKNFNFVELCENKKWEFVGPNQDQINLTQVSRIKMADMVMRVSNATTQRSKYWLFQFALIGKIHAIHPNKPIIYIVNDKDEINNLIEYATSLGYYIPTNGSGFRKLQYIGNRLQILVLFYKFRDSRHTTKEHLYIFHDGFYILTF